MNEWWQNLSERERITTLVGTIILLLILLYLFIWSPIKNSVDTMRKDTKYQTSLLHWMQHSSNKLMALRSTKQVTTQLNTSQLLTVADQSIREQKLRQYVTKITQKDNEKIEIGFNNVPFDQLTNWLIFSWQKYRIRVYSITVTNNKNAPGFVRSEVVLKIE